MELQNKLELGNVMCVFTQEANFTEDTPTLLKDVGIKQFSWYMKF